MHSEQHIIFITFKNVQIRRSKFICSLCTHQSDTTALNCHQSIHPGSLPYFQCIVKTPVSVSFVWCIDSLNCADQKSLTFQQLANLGTTSPNLQHCTHMQEPTCKRRRRVSSSFSSTSISSSFSHSVVTNQCVLQLCHSALSFLLI